jgi:hypothetical protein
MFQWAGDISHMTQEPYTYLPTTTTTSCPIPMLLDTLFWEHARIKAQCAKATTILHWHKLCNPWKSDQTLRKNTLETLTILCLGRSRQRNVMFDSFNLPSLPPFTSSYPPGVATGPCGAASHLAWWGSHTTTPCAAEQGIGDMSSRS